MNQPSFRDELEHLVHGRPLEHTDIEVIVGTAKARTRRRRAAGALGVAALTTVTAVGINEMATTDSLQSTSDSVTSGSATTVADPSATTTVLLPAFPEPAVAQAASFLPADAVPATPTDPVMTWTVIEGDSPEALAFRYGGSDERYALATETSVGSDLSQRSLYERVDGAWVPVASDVLPDGLPQATVSGDTIYAVGTEPATAGAEPGAVGTYDIAAGAWNLLPLPEEARGYRGDAVQVNVTMSIAPVDGGALVALSRSDPYFTDPELLTAVAGAEVYQYRVVDGGAEVASGCDSAALERDMAPVYESSPATAAVDAAYRQALANHCTVQLLSAADFGLAGEDLARFGQPALATLWRFDGSALTPIDLPDPDATSLNLAGPLLTTSTPTGESRAWLIAPDGSFTEVFAGVYGRSPGGASSAFDGGAVMGFASAIATADRGGASTYVDLAPVLVDDTMINPNVWINTVAATADATVATASVDYRMQGALTERTTISDHASDFDLVVDPEGGVTVVERSSGMVAADGYRLTTEAGSVQLVAVDGQDLALVPDPGGPVPPVATTVPATVAAPGGASSVPWSVAPGYSTLPTDDGEVLATFDIDPATIPIWAQRYEERIVSSVDGRAYASESVRDLLGLTDEQASTSPVKVVDGRFVVSVQVWRPEQNVEPRTVYLVGTPTA